MKGKSWVENCIKNRGLANIYIFGNLKIHAYFKTILIVIVGELEMNDVCD